MAPHNSASPNGETVPPTPPSTTISSGNKPERWLPVKPAPTPFDWGEFLLKLVAPAITAAGLVIGVWQYQDQQASNDTLEFKRTMWNKRLAAYEEISMVAAELATSFPPGNAAAQPPSAQLAAQRQQAAIRFDSLSRRFYVLYWGKLPLIDDDKVAQALKDFNDELKSVELGESTEVRLKKQGYNLVKTCQHSLNESWHEDLAHQMAAGASPGAE